MTDETTVYGMEDFEPETSPVRFKAGGKPISFTVRGLNVVDLGELLAAHRHDIESLVALAAEMKKMVFANAVVDDLVLVFCRDTPTLVAEVISVAAGQPHRQDKFLALPASVTSYALSEILRMTLEEHGGLKNLKASLIRLVTPFLEKLGNPAAAETQTA